MMNKSKQAKWWNTEPRRHKLRNLMATVSGFAFEFRRCRCRSQTMNTREQLFPMPTIILLYILFSLTRFIVRPCHYHDHHHHHHHHFHLRPAAAAAADASGCFIHTINMYLIMIITSLNKKETCSIQCAMQWCWSPCKSIGIHLDDGVCLLARFFFFFAHFHSLSFCTKLLLFNIWQLLLSLLSFVWNDLSTVSSTNCRNVAGRWLLSVPQANTSLNRQKFMCNKLLTNNGHQHF